MTSTQFFSVTKFITKLNEQENIIKKDHNIVDPIISVYFEGNDAFKNKYGICFKPIFMTNRTESKPKSIRFDRIQEIYGCQPIISCKENDNKSLPNGKDKKDMFVLDIYLNQKEFKGNKYYPSHMRKCSNNESVEKIRKHVADCQKTDFDDFILI